MKNASILENDQFYLVEDYDGNKFVVMEEDYNRIADSVNTIGKVPLKRPGKIVDKSFSTNPYYIIETDKDKFEVAYIRDNEHQLDIGEEIIF